MRILALNCGSSSIKAAIFEGPTLDRLAEGRAEQIGTTGATLRVADHDARLDAHVDLASAAELLLGELNKRAGQRAPVTAVVHRVVHGGEQFTRPTAIDDGVLASLERLAALAPLHNPPALAVIRSARRAMPAAPHFAVFDTAFHATLPPRAKEYALPQALKARHGIRRFGFHGISHENVMKRVAQECGATPQALRIVSCHLGNGASVTAIEYGRSVETSMGMTPLEGLVMGSRAGDVDPGVLLELMRTHDRESLERLLMHESGLIGLTGTNDMRQIEQRAEQGEEGCRLAVNVYAHRVRKYIGAYAATMGGVDAIAFTGGIGENSPFIRHRCLQRLDFLGARLDEDRNRDALRAKGADCEELSESGSRVRLFALRADEERAMAESVRRLLEAPAKAAGQNRIPIAVSARHAHLSQATIDVLFGPGYSLTPRKDLSQTGQFSAQESITLIGPRGRLEKVRLMGPPRKHDQIEISRTDEFTLGVDAPVRISGDLANTPGITIEGPRGRVTRTSGLIAARRHIHMSDQDAARLGVRDCETVDVRIDSDGRDLTFNDVTVRVDPTYTLELHLDTDEANAAGVSQGDEGELVVR
jgi:acetate kinase